MLDSMTYEEANSRLANWIRQRSRWIKGYLLTSLVHMRSPRRLYRDLGFKGSVEFFGAFVGGPFVALVSADLLDHAAALGRRSRHGSPSSSPAGSITRASPASSSGPSC